MKLNISEKGFLIIKKAISLKTIKEIQLSILQKFSNKKPKASSYEEFEKIVKKNTKKEFKFVEPANNEIYANGLIEKLLNEKKIFKVLTELLGKDLCYLVDNVLTLNLPNKANSKLNYHFKDWHQEIWSGADISTLQLWIPFFQKNNQSGQIDIIPGSHTWGHVPHSNRKPLIMPKSYKTLKTKLNIGDILVFNTTLMHKTTETKFPRLAFPILIKNFKYKNNSFENNRNWKIFSYSEITKIERALGNHHLSPFRITNKDQFFSEGTIKKD